MELREVDARVTHAQQLQDDGGPIVLFNEFNLAPEAAEPFLEVWADNAAIAKRQLGYTSMQMYRGTAGRTTGGVVAVSESANALGCAFLPPEFQNLTAGHPDSTVAAPHVFKKVAVPGIRVA
jgi:heme-degrading monooxygenase HmoA